MIPLAELKKLATNADDAKRPLSLWPADEKAFADACNPEIVLALIAAVEAATVLLAHAEECEFDDRMQQVAPLKFWHELDDAIAQLGDMP